MSLWERRNKKLSELLDRKDTIRKARKAEGHRGIREAYKSLDGLEGEDADAIRQILRQKEERIRSGIPLKRLLAREAMQEKLTEQDGKGIFDGEDEDE